MKLRLMLMLVASGGPLLAQNLRGTTQVIEVPHAVLTAWTAGPARGGAEMHRLARGLAEQGDARVVDTSIVTGKAEYRVEGESRTECIYPTESEPHAPILVPSEPAQGIAFFRPAFRYAPTAFETRNAGVSLEAFATGVDEDGIDLGLHLEIVGDAPATEWKTFRDEWGDASVRFPTFRTHRQNVVVRLMPGAYEWVGVMHPQPGAVPEVVRRWLVFARVEVLTLGGAE